MLKYITVIFFLGHFVAILAQSTTNTPFSSRGLGLHNVSRDPIQTALGRSSVAFNDTSALNLQNASSHFALSKGNPLFSMALSSNYSTFQEGDVTFSNNVVGIDHFVLAIPFSGKYGIAFGLTPYATRGYDLINTQAIDGDTLRYNYLGTGTISKAFVGLSYAPIIRDNFTWSIGSNLGYLFGRTANHRYANLVSQTNNLGESPGGIYIQSNRITSFHYDLSTSLMYQFREGRRINLSAVITPSQNLKGSYSNEQYTSTTNVYNPSSYFENFNSNFDNVVKSANKVALGLNYNYSFKRTSGKNKEFTSVLNTVVSFDSEQFSQMSQLDSLGNSVSMYNNDYSKVSLGFQYTPDRDFVANSITNKFYQKIKYRVGVYAAKLPYSQNSEQLTQFGTTFGFGIPVVTQFALSSFNFAFDLGQRGTGSPAALNEKYIGFHVGVVISPSKADSWFRKLELD
ncbi:MAG: hypothetical protein ACI9G9_000589 [Psychromonas sp.]|jgi:hypothetical protein